MAGGKRPNQENGGGGEAKVCWYVELEKSIVSFQKTKDANWDPGEVFNVKEQMEILDVEEVANPVNNDSEHSEMAWNGQCQPRWYRHVEWA